MKNYKLKALEKLEKESSSKSKSMKAEAVKASVLEQLICFIKQDEEFARAIIDCDKTINDCCEAAVKDCGNSISDLEIYQKAVAFYFPGATVNMVMTIDLCGSVRDSSASAKVINLSFTDLFD